VSLGGVGEGGELLEAVGERAAEAGEAVAEGGDGVVLADIKVRADFFGGVDLVIEVGDEGRDGLLEVDVVLPEGVVGVEEEGLAGGFAGGVGKERHRNMVADRGGVPI
jgi:hypothetical protein